MHVHRPHLTLSWRLVALVLAFSMVAVLFAGVSPAFAQSGTPRLPAGANALQRAYQREQKWLTLQTDNLKRGDQVATRLQTFIDNQNGKGKDTTKLAAALAAAKTQLADAHSAHDAAAALLSTHAGFDNSGKVTDLAQARQTLTSAVQSLWKSHRTLCQALRDMRVALRTYRQANKTS